MIAAQPDQEMREALIAALFDWPNNTWQQIMGEASKDYTILQQSDVMRTLADILKVFIRGAVSLRHAFVSQVCPGRAVTGRAFWKGDGGGDGGVGVL